MQCRRTCAVSSSHSTTPKEYASVAKLSVSALSISGGMYASAPCCAAVAATWPGRNSVDRPKSDTCACRLYYSPYVRDPASTQFPTCPHRDASCDPSGSMRL